MRNGALESESLEQDLDDTRSRLDATIGALQEKLAPGSVVDQAVHYFREGGGVEFSRNLTRSMRENPIPVALIGVGLGWLVLSGARRDGHRAGGWREETGGERFGGPGRYGHGRGYAGELAETSVHQPMPYEAAAYEDLAAKAHRAGADLRRETGESDDLFQDRVHAARGHVLGVTRHAGEESHSFRQRVEEAMHAAAERVRAMAADAGATASHLVDRGQEMARDLYEQGQSTFGDVRHRAGSAVGQMRSAGGRGIDYLQEQPLLLGALGITVGAVIGMLVPASRYERRMAVSVREQLGDTARDVAGEAGRRALRVAETVLDTAHETTRREGFGEVSGRGLAAEAHERVADVAGRARHVVEESAAAGREALRRELSGEGTAKGNGTPGATERAGTHGERHAGL